MWNAAVQSVVTSFTADGQTKIEAVQRSARVTNKYSKTYYVN